MRPRCIGVTLGQVPVQARIHVLRSPDGGGRDVACRGDIGYVSVEQGGAVGEVAEGDNLGLGPVEVAAEQEGEEAVDGLGHMAVGTVEVIGGGDGEAVVDAGEGSVGGLLGGSVSAVEAECHKERVEGEKAVREVRGEEAGGEAHEGEEVVVGVEEGTVRSRARMKSDGLTI